LNEIHYFIVVKKAKDSIFKKKVHILVRILLVINKINIVLKILIIYHL